MPRSAGKRTVALFAACALVLSSLSYFAPAVAQAQAAKTQLTAGDKAAAAKDWQKALDAYEAAYKAQPNAESLDGVANAHYQLQHDVDAYRAYAEWMKLYGDKAPKAKKAAAEARLKDLATRTGELAITVNEAGATVTIDEKPAGTSPIAPLRIAAGPHHVRITKTGFLPYDQAPNVTAAQTTSLDVKLEAPSAKGRLLVREKTGKPIRILVDGVDVGDAPWDGEVGAGQHDVAGRGVSATAPAEKVTVEGGKTKEVELIASSTTAPLKIATSDGKGLIYLDGKLVGEGTYSADVPAGPHNIKVTRDGYDPFEDDIVLKDKEPFSRSITLNLVSKIETAPVQKTVRALEGVYGGFAFIGATLLGGTKSSMQKTCDGAHPTELASCSSGSDLGAGLGGFVGYHWDPVGIELYLAGHYDQQKNTLDWDASSTDPGLGPDPARTEEFTTRRVGGLAAFRVRYTAQGEKIRFSMAAGVGLAYRLMFLTRTTTAKADPTVQDKFVTDKALTYWSPVLSFEPTIHYRLSGGLSISLGLLLLFDNPTAFHDKPPQSPREGFHRLGLVGLTTPSYDLATGTQVYFGPTLGMMFGP